MRFKAPAVGQRVVGKPGGIDNKINFTRLPSHPEGGFMYRNLGVGLFAALMGTCAIASSAQSAPQITKPVNENQRTAAGTAPPAAQVARNDRGRVADGFALHGMRILMHRSTAQQAALDKLTEDLHNPRSPNYHKWLTASQFAQRFGVDKADVNAVRSWLESHGFHVNSVSRDRTLVTFSGNAGQVREAFRTEVHKLMVNGQHHFANTSTPTVPAALKPGVEGLIALNDFRPHPNFRPKTAYTFQQGSTTYHAIVPEDLATIYNFTPAYNRGITGRGQTIAVLEEGDIQDLSNWNKFRRTFGLSNYKHGSFTQEQPAGSTECDDPGVNGAEDEANLDAQWSGAAAPDAAIIAAACADSASDFGLYIAMENLLEQATPPKVMSISYGECEVFLGRQFNHHIANLYQQADAEGVSVFVSTGDEGSAECDQRAAVAVHGISVSGMMSTPYNVAVGGTDFADTYLGTSNLYWNDTNDQYYGSAKSYMPEMPWDDSCANGPITQVEGYSQPYGDTGFCNEQGNPFIDTVAGSGGPSGCATGRPSEDGVVSGTCAGYQKPSWQTGLSIPSDGVRDTPDVALMAANGVLGTLSGLLRHRRWKLRRCPKQLARWWRNVLRDPDLGGHPGAGGPEHRFSPRQPQPHLL